MLFLAGKAANATENLDAGKSGAKLFADSCSACHRSPRGLAKGRFRLTLYLFLQQHYVSNSDSASALTSYLQSVDEASRQPVRGTRPAHAKDRPDKPPRPPMAVPARP
jgi:mono/diheme cytochrome c family protein